MKEFNRIIGYEHVKNELEKVCDIMRNPDPYKKLGADTPRGILLYGVPGVGKTLFADSFMKACGRKKFTVRRTKPGGDFVKSIEKTFVEAAKNAPSVILLDDMDKYVVNKDGREEYVAVQACIDKVKGKDVFVFATANEIRSLPKSLVRAGRFDSVIEINPPEGEDADRIVAHYIRKKKMLSDINTDDIAKLLYGHSCAELESIINEAAINAGYERSRNVEMNHLVNAVVRKLFHIVPDSWKTRDTEIEVSAYHEAGHACISEILSKGSVGMVAIAGSGKEGITHSCTRVESDDDILISLAGRESVMMRFGKYSPGSEIDYQHATYLIMEDITQRGRYGSESLKAGHEWDNPSESLYARHEAVFHTVLDIQIQKTRQYLAEHADFVRAVAEELIDKRILLHSDMQRIRESIFSDPDTLVIEKIA